MSSRSALASVLLPSLLPLVPLLFSPSVTRAEPEPHMQALLDGEQALSARQFFRAYRRCGDSARVSGPHRGRAYTCQARAALGFGALIEAEAKARVATREPFPPRDATAALADALRLQGKCKDAIPLYLWILDEEPDNAQARTGAKACNVDLPGGAR